MKLERMLAKAETRIHFEMGAFTDSQLLRFLIEHVFPRAHSMGLNEQELDILYRYLIAGELGDYKELDTNQQIEMVVKTF